MLLIPFQAGDQWYALDAASVVEIVPFVPLRIIPRTPSVLAGILDYRGRLVPVMDLCRLLADSPVDRHMSTRIMIASRSGKNGACPLVGLVAHHILDTMQCREKDLIPSCASTGGQRFLGKIVRTEKGLIQLLTAEDILPQEVLCLLDGEDNEHGFRHHKGN